MQYLEAGSSTFQTSSFPWRELAVSGLPGWRGGAAPTISSVDSEKRSFSGVFSYNSGSAVASTNRNRFILWKCCGHSLYLLEMSLDCSLAHAALQLEMKDGSCVLPNVTVQELEGNSVAVLFATSSCVFRLLLPHPDTISKNPMLSSAGGGLQPSVFASVKATSLQGSNMASLFSDHSSVQLVTCVSGCISPAGNTTFALASPSGSIHLIHLSPPHEPGLPARTELRQFSVINKLWASVVPSAFRGAGPTEDAPVSVAMHSFGGNMVVLALCRDMHLRLWATEPAECIMTCDLEEYLVQDTESESALSCVNLCLRKAAEATSTCLRFAVYIETTIASQVSLFQLLVVDRQLHLEHISSFPCIGEKNLVDMCCSNSDVWAVWRESDGGECVKHLTYDGEVCYAWKKARLSPLPPQDIFVSPSAEPRGFFLDAMFYSGRFSISAVNKALELYGVKSDNMSVQQLREVATATIERELRSSADSTQLHHEQFRELQIKCWTKFYNCCCQYQELMNVLVGVFLDPTTGMVGLFKEEGISFMYPVPATDCSSYEHLGILHQGDDHLHDIENFLEAAKLTRNQLNSEMQETLLSSEDPVELATELAEAIANTQSKENMAYKEKLQSLLLPVGSVSKLVCSLVAALDPTSEDETIEHADVHDSETQLALSQLFASPLSERLLSEILRERCLARLTVAGDVLLLLCLLQHQGKVENMNQSLYKLSTLLRNYHVLHWLCCQSVVPASPLSLENNLRHLAALNISSSSKQSPFNSDYSVLELYLRGRGGQELRGALIRSQTSHDSLSSVWSELLPQCVNILLTQLWPSSNSVSVCQFLLSACQHTHLQDYVAETKSFVSEGKDSMSFLLAQSYLTTGEIEKATRCFLSSVSYPGYSSEDLLQQVISTRGEDGGGKQEPDKRKLLKYFLRVVGLFEQASCHLAVLKVAKTAVMCFDKDDTAVLWSILFKYHLHLGYYEDAYMDMMNNPDLTRRKECLHHFVVVLTEQNQLKLICHLNYPGMEEEIVRVMEDRARSMDLMKHKYYDLLYCYHTTKQNYRKAASVMYEYGLRLGREAPGTQSLRKQANCYCMCLTALHLAQPQYAWVVVPVELEEIMEKNTKMAQNRKRPHPSEGKQQVVQVEVRTISDIEKDYSLVRTKISLLRVDPSVATQIYSPFVSPEEVVARLIQVGLFDKAIDTALCFELPLDSIFEALASRCVHLTSNLIGFRDETEDVSTWLDANQSIDIPTPIEKSVVDKAWLMLKSYLETYDQVHDHKLQKCVAKKLMSLGSHLPQWLVQSFKETNPAELLRLYLSFNLLEEAALFAMHYIDAVLGPRKEEFAMQTTLHVSSPSVWLPYSSLDHLRITLQKADSPSLLELSSQLSAKLEDYFRMTSSVTADMEHQARLMITH